MNLPALCLDRLEPRQYVAPRGVERGGARALTHRAIVRIGGRERRCYVKVFPRHFPCGLVNEIVGHTLAHHAGVPQPRGALIRVARSIVEPLFGATHLPPGTSFPAFVSVEAVDVAQRRAGTVKALFGDDLDLIAAALAKWPKLPQLIAFDAWVANVDRNTGNLMITGPGNFEVIDHSDILTGPAWTADDMEPLQWSLVKLLDLVFNDARRGLPLPVKNAIVKSAERFLSTYAAARPELEFWLGGESCSPGLRAHHFLWHRADSVVERLKERVRVLL